MDYPQQIALQLQINSAQVFDTITLLDAGNTIPFIARYRKEATGSLDEEQLRQIEQWLGKLRLLDERRQTILRSIEEQGQLTPELSQQIKAAASRTELEDLYQPYKPKRRTRASIAREFGLQGLAELILQQDRTTQTLHELVRPYLNEQVPTSEAAFSGAMDIVAEVISDHTGVRQELRQKALDWGILYAEKTGSGEDPRAIYALYYQFSCRISRLRPHQILAINRGEKDKILRVWVEVPERDWRQVVGGYFYPDRRSSLADKLELAIVDAAERLLLPAIERDARRELNEIAERHAIEVFASNLRALLSTPPLSGRVVLGIDPGYRTGCKLAVVDPTGKVLETGTIYPHEPTRRWEAAKEALASLVAKYGVSLITIGNGTASRETEKLVAELIQQHSKAQGQAESHSKQPPGKGLKDGGADGGLYYMIVSEAGASVYSASTLARGELPGMDVSLRGAVSIVRRAQDPLAELVKIDPKSIGIGLYQHDVDQKLLTQALTAVVESVVNAVGVDVNTASASLLTYVAGIGPKLAERIVAYRDQNGPFVDRQVFVKIPGLGAKAFEQSAGFLRIRGGANPLDASAIHPESYLTAKKILSAAGLKADAPPEERMAKLSNLKQESPLEELAARLGVGLPTLEDIFEQLHRPGRDPRADLQAPMLRSDVLAMEDLQPGMRLKGTVRNVVDFGAFIDIGVKQDGLLHRSQFPSGIRLQVGDIIEVVILKIEIERGRIGLGLPG